MFKKFLLAGAFLEEITAPWGTRRVGFSVSGKVNHKNFGLTWYKVLETGGVTLRDEGEIGLQV